MSCVTKEMFAHLLLLYVCGCFGENFPCMWATVYVLHVELKVPLKKHCPVTVFEHKYLQKSSYLFWIQSFRVPVESRLMSSGYALYTVCIKKRNTEPLSTFLLRGKMIPAELESSIVAAKEKV